eukprot:scaffold351_cov162-Ochromonas_danica.AAC.4
MVELLPFHTVCDYTLAVLSDGNATHSADMVMYGRVITIRGPHRLHFALSSSNRQSMEEGPHCNTLKPHRCSFYLRRKSYFLVRESNPALSLERAIS